jgi:hypothetical protein
MGLANGLLSADIHLPNQGKFLLTDKRCIVLQRRDLDSTNIVHVRVRKKETVIQKEIRIVRESVRVEN